MKADLNQADSDDESYVSLNKYHETIANRIQDNRPKQRGSQYLNHRFTLRGIKERFSIISGNRAMLSIIKEPFDHLIFEDEDTSKDNKETGRKHVIKSRESAINHMIYYMNQNKRNTVNESISETVGLNPKFIQPNLISSEYNIQNNNSIDVVEIKNMSKEEIKEMIKLTKEEIDSVIDQANHLFEKLNILDSVIKSEDSNKPENVFDFTELKSSIQGVSKGIAGMSEAVSCGLETYAVILKDINQLMIKMVSRITCSESWKAVQPLDQLEKKEDFYYFHPIETSDQTEEPVQRVRLKSRANKTKIDMNKSLDSSLNTSTLPIISKPSENSHSLQINNLQKEEYQSLKPKISISRSPLYNPKQTILRATRNKLVKQKSTSTNSKAGNKKLVLNGKNKKLAPMTYQNDNEKLLLVREDGRSMVVNPSILAQFKKKPNGIPSSFVKKLLYASEEYASPYLI